MRGAIAIISALMALIAAACIMIYAVEIDLTGPGGPSRAHFVTAGPMPGGANHDALANDAAAIPVSQDVHLPVIGLMIPVAAHPRARSSR